MDLVVTGANGFVGQAVVEHYISQLTTSSGHFSFSRILAVDVALPKFDDVHVVNVKMDLAAAADEDLRFVFRLASVVIHLAAVVDTRSTQFVARRIQKVNVEMAGRVAQFAVVSPHFERFVFLSSVAGMLPFVSPYGKSKAEAEKIIQNIVPSEKLVILRPHVVYGKGDSLGTAAVSKIPRFFPVPFLSNVDMNITTIEVQELASIIARCTEASNAEIPKISPLFVGEKTTFRSLIEEKILKRKKTFITLPSILVYPFALISEGIDILLKSRFSWAVFRILNRSAFKYMSVEEPVSISRVGLDMQKLALAFQENCGNSTSMKKEGSDLALICSPAQLGPLTMRSRIIKAATFEAMRGEQLSRFHAAFARHNTALNVVSYGAVTEDGKTFDGQLCFENDAEALQAEMHQVAAAVHKEGGKVAIQLTHAGAFSSARPPVGPRNWVPNPLTFRFSRKLTAKDKERIAKGFEKGVVVSHAAGFDAVEVHCGHGYLLSQCIRAGDQQFPVEVVKRVAVVAHELGMAVLVKFNVDEGIERTGPLARAFVDSGADLLVPSGGHVMINGFGMLRGGRPLLKMAHAQTSWLQWFGLFLFGPVLIPKHPYQEGFYRRESLSTAFAAKIPMSKIALIGGVQRRKTAADALEIGAFSFVCLGRALLRDLQWGEKIKESEVELCDQCNECVVDPTMAHKPLKCTKRLISEW